MPDVVTLSGSPVMPSRSQHLLCVAEEMLCERGYSVRRIDVRQLPAQALIYGDWNDPAVRAALETVVAARAVIVATPLYKASYSGALKTLLDLLPQAAFAHKPVLAFATGGSLAHLLALDYALKPVLVALGARLMLDNVFATECDLHQTNGAYTLTGSLAQRLSSAVESLAQALEDREALARLRASTVLDQISAVAQ
ncbi:FMN reductase (NADPH) [Paraburkholderia aspalathi]|uniref:FMN reductase (NADPH) n=1 Tax=Paraburkholderia aspalathi TaxID=1324617 RepID=A0ABM8T958_9BURK|nr:NADPH-dependent FMN reductase [Paraburkholderia aspalathi]MBK3824352.1 NADPH-dependent FMN reductase [Paraburkholderia aspalathi]MBK3836210.1 NADPH-dependent FMN reductase [Paraburkholderia aspalathi]MBK3865972.1 NADPH-dependent FMN reductase [Paraburkholderia aspalathi]CAE6871137.1 FMN reductase (NADPH) [Paraburkholderia aspalathi]